MPKLVINFEDIDDLTAMMELIEKQIREGYNQGIYEGVTWEIN